MEESKAKDNPPSIDLANDYKVVNFLLVGFRVALKQVD